MNKCASRLIYLYISTLFFSFLFIQFIFSSPANATEGLIINGKHQMGLGDTQALSIMNYRTGLSYVWIIVSGAGTLSSNTGQRVEYNAPDSNPDCVNNPIIGVTDSDGNYGEITISVNCYPARAVAYKYGRECHCAEYVNGHFVWGCGAKAYGCNGQYLGQTSPSSACWSTHSWECGSCPGWCDRCGGENEFIDVRTDDMKASGCCPGAAQSWYQPPPSVPKDVDHGKDPQANKPVCDPSLKGNPIRIYNGNNIETDEDLRFVSPDRRGFRFKRFYNSRLEAVGPMGYGWTHSYSAYLEPAYEYTGEVFLRIVDASGRGVYFVDDGDGHYVGAFKEKTRVELEGDNYVWYRLDGSRLVFESVGRLSWIEDEIGNRQVLTYDDADRLQRVTDEASHRVLTFSYNEAGLLDHVSGPVTTAVPSGIWVSYTYDANQNLTSVVFADGSGFMYGYTDPNDVHNLTEKKDAMGHVLSTWAYDDQDRATQSSTRDGRGVTINYIDENEVEVTNAYGIISTYGIWDIDGRKRVTDIESPQGCPECGSDVVRLEYDADLRVIEVEYANGLINQYDDFDGHGNARIVRKAVGTSDERTITYTFHPTLKEMLSQAEDSLLGPGHKVTIWDYDNDGNDIPNEEPSRLLYRKIERGFTRDIAGDMIPYEYITTYSYNNKGQVLTIDGPDPGSQDMTTLTYDDITGDLLSVTRPVVGTTTYSEYDEAGYVHRVNDPNGNAKAFTYDGRGRTATVTNEADSGTVSYEYNDAGELARLTRANGTSFDLVYDETYGRLKRVIDHLGNYIYYTYDDRGNRTELSYFNSSDEHLYWKRFDYQGPTRPGRLWRVLNPDDTYMEYSYDTGGNIHLIRDPGGKTTSYDYDILNRLIAVTQPGNTVTSYAYDRRGNLTGLTDAENHTTGYLYDDLGRLVYTTSPDTGITSYSYDASGNLVSKVDAKGNGITYTYDDLNRLTGIHFGDPDRDITYTYDQGENGKGRLTGIYDPTGVYSYSYDGQGNIISEQSTIEGFTYITQYTYDLSGTLTGITYPDGRSVTYELDSAGRVAGVSATKENATSILAEHIDYLPFGPLHSLTYGNGTILTRTYDQLYRLTGTDSNNVQGLSYALDPAGNITSITDNLDSTRDQSFYYDDLNRIVSAVGIYGTISYTYDKVGNRMTRTRDGESDTYGYEAGTNRLAQITGANPQTFSYDANGNIASTGSMSLSYNQNNRLIQATENGVILAEYAYNANGQRVKKTVGDTTTIYHYDHFGNLTGESSPDGKFLEEYVCLGNTRLAMISHENPQELTVKVATSKGRNVSGINVYAFSGDGSYTGKSAVSDGDGVAHFQLSDFSEGTYKFRADYLSYHFWSEMVTIPGTYSTDIQIVEEGTIIRVTQGGNPREGIRVYLFNDNGSYLGVYDTTDENGEVIFTLPVEKAFRFRADVLGSQYFSGDVTIVPDGPNTYEIDAGGGILRAIVDKGEGSPIAGIKVYLFNAQRSYMGIWDQSDSEGGVDFDVPAGTYKVRADYMGYQFWSQELSVSADDTVFLSIPHQDVTITVNGDYNGNIDPKQDLDVYLFSFSGSYLGQEQITDDNGQVSFGLPEREYKVRADYMGQQDWSSTFTWTDSTISINEGEAEITVINMGLPLEGVNVYAFNSSGSYLGVYDVTDENGKTSFRFPAGDYNFRGDYMGNQYWSGMSTLIADVINPLNISTGGGSFTLTELKGPDDPLVGVDCYLFNESWSYLGEHKVTSSQGGADFNLADGVYRVRVDYLGYQFWTDVFGIPATTSLTHTLDHQGVTITVEGNYNGDVEPREGLNVYLFTPSGSYLSQCEVTDDQGKITFDLPQKDYKVRADYMGQQYWSDIFNWTSDKITLNEGIADVHVSQGGALLKDVSIYVFTSSGSYLGLNAKTDTDGIVNFRLPEGTYKFRADYLAKQYWSTETVNAHQVNVINVDTGGGPFTLTVEKEAGVPLVDVPVYAFTSGGSYLGMNSHTDDNGQVSFDLSGGDYKFRADYLGYQFWSNITTVPTNLSDVLIIPHQDVTVTVEGVYQASSDSMEGIRVYLFKETGSYLGQYIDTNAQGQIIFNLPEEAYKVRADYLGYQFWSDAFVWDDTAVTINQGLAKLHITKDGADVVDAPVYLFKASGSYLGKYERTDEGGMAEFLLPDQAYKFRVDCEGTKYWSDEQPIIPDQENDIELNLDLLALDLTNDPNPVRFDGTPPKVRPKNILVASIGSLTGLLFHSVVAQTPSDKIYYYINDHLGTPLKVIDEDGAVVWSADYMPYGDADITVNNIENNFRFPGQYYDIETGLHYNYFRYYDPITGRYLTPDPSHYVQPRGINIPCVFHSLLDLQYELNPFCYVSNNPMAFIDAVGLYKSIGGGFGITAALFSLTFDIHTYQCCDKSNTKHLMTVSSFCYGQEIGLGVKGGSSSSISDEKKVGKCPKLDNTDSWQSSHGSSVWGSLIIFGRSHDITENESGTAFGFGGGYRLWMECHNHVIVDVPIGSCSEEGCEK